MKCHARFTEFGVSSQVEGQEGGAWLIMNDSLAHEGTPVSVTVLYLPSSETG